MSAAPAQPVRSRRDDAQLWQRLGRRALDRCSAAADVRPGRRGVRPASWTCLLGAVTTRCGIGSRPTAACRSDRGSRSAACLDSGTRRGLVGRRVAIDVFARGSDGALWGRAMVADGWTRLVLARRHGFERSRRGSTGVNRLDVFVRGRDNALWHAVWNGSPWFAVAASVAVRRLGSRRGRSATVNESMSSFAEQTRRLWSAAGTARRGRLVPARRRCVRRVRTSLRRARVSSTWSSTGSTVRFGTRPVPAACGLGGTAGGFRSAWPAAAPTIGPGHEPV